MDDDGFQLPHLDPEDDPATLKLMEAEEEAQAIREGGLEPDPNKIAKAEEELPF